MLSHQVSRNLLQQPQKSITERGESRMDPLGFWVFSVVVYRVEEVQVWDGGARIKNSDSDVRFEMLVTCPSRESQ